jgi:hypothetical protein
MSEDWVSCLRCWSTWGGVSVSVPLYIFSSSAYGVIAMCESNLIPICITQILSSLLVTHYTYKLFPRMQQTPKQESRG